MLRFFAIFSIILLSLVVIGNQLKFPFAATAKAIVRTVQEESNPRRAKIAQSQNTAPESLAKANERLEALLAQALAQQEQMISNQNQIFERMAAIEVKIKAGEAAPASSENTESVNVPLAENVSELPKNDTYHSEILIPEVEANQIAPVANEISPQAAEPEAKLVEAKVETAVETQSATSSGHAAVNTPILVQAATPTEEIGTYPKDEPILNSLVEAQEPEPSAVAPATADKNIEELWGELN